MTTALRSDNDINATHKQNLHSQYDLSHTNTMALSCVVDTAVILDDEAQLDNFMAQYLANDNLPLFVLSGGSNVLLPARLKAIVLRPLMRGIQITGQTEDYVDVEVMAGENWHDLVLDTVAKGWFGLENLALIPGLTGAAPIQNIGAYGVQLQDCLQYVRAYHLPSRTWRQLTAAECEFGYRDSIFKRTPHTWLITRVGFRLHTDPTRILASYGDVQTVAQTYAQQQGRTLLSPTDVMQAIIDIRQQKLPDPKQLPNCGSFFQNPIITQSQFSALQVNYPSIVGYPMPDARVKVAAGWLIEQAGLKGGGIEPIMTHTKQALVLTNHNPYKATQDDVATTQNYIINTIYDKFAITLAREPVWVNADATIGHGQHVV